MIELTRGEVAGALKVAMTSPPCTCSEIGREAGSSCRKGSSPLQSQLTPYPHPVQAMVRFPPFPLSSSAGAS